MEEKLGEYEMIIIEQRELLIKSEDENCKLKRQFEEGFRQKERDIEIMEQKVRSLSEINKKYE